MLAISQRASDISRVKVEIDGLITASSNGARGATLSHKWSVSEQLGQVQSAASVTCSQTCPPDSFGEDWDHFTSQIYLICNILTRSSSASAANLPLSWLQLLTATGIFIWLRGDDSTPRPGSGAKGQEGEAKSCEAGLRTTLDLVLSNKHLQVLDLQTESPELLTALTSLSTFYTENTPTARRQLRSTLEQRSLQVNQEYLSAAEGVLKVCCMAYFHLKCTEKGMNALCYEKLLQVSQFAKF